MCTATRWRCACGRRGRVAARRRTRPGSTRPPAVSPRWPPGWRSATSRWPRWRPRACTGSPSTTRWKTGSSCGCATPITSRTSLAARRTCPMPSGWPTWPRMGWCGPASCRRFRSGELRELTRYRKTQVDARAAEIARLEKVLQDAGIKLTSVASKVLTQSGRAMIEALIAGERDPAALAGLAKGKLRPKIPQLTAALSGHFGAHHAVVAARILAHLDSLDDAIAVLDGQIAARVAGDYQSAARLLADVPGLERRSVEVIIAETGADMSRFPSPAHLASWAGLCPGNHESAGKRRKVATTPGNPWLRRTLIESARAAARTKDSYFGAQYRQIARRRGPNKAAVAVAHSLLDVIWPLLTTGEVFADLGADYFTSRQDKEHQTQRLVRQDRKSTRLNSSHVEISYAVFCLKKKKK